MSSLLTKLFPTPSFLSIPAMGLDFSDATMRFIKLEKRHGNIVPVEYAEVAIPEGCMQGGRVMNEEVFVSFVRDVRKKYGMKYVRVAIPESQIYSFTVSLDIVVKKDIRNAIELVIEENIPLRAVETIFDYHILSSNEKNILVQVVAVSEVTAQSFFSCLVRAGLSPISFELDGQAIARAVLPHGHKGSSMVVDFGARRTSIAIVANGITVYTATIDFGGKALTQILATKLNITADEAEHLKREYGLSHTGEHKELFSIISDDVHVLREEINRRYTYWYEKKDELGGFPMIETIYLCGGHSNLRGLADYLSASLTLNIVQADPWVNCLSYETVIPTMTFETSMSYVTAIGLALADYLYD